MLINKIFYKMFSILISFISIMIFLTLIINWEITMSRMNDLLINISNFIIEKLYLDEEYDFENICNWILDYGPSVEEMKEPILLVNEYWKVYENL